MGATLINSNLILNEILALLETNSVALKFVDRQYSNQFGKSGTYGKPGTKISVRKPIKVSVRQGSVSRPCDITEDVVEITNTTQFGVDLPAFTSEMLTMNVDDFSNRYIKPCAATIAAYLDAQICAQYDQFYNSVGTPGTVPQSALTFLQAGQKLTEDNVPTDDDRIIIVDPQTEAYMVDALKGLFVPSATLEEQYKRGTMGQAFGFKFSMDQNITSLTCGSRSGTILVDEPGSPNNIAQGMKTIHIDGMSGSATIRKGEVFTIANVYKVNPLSKVPYSTLQQFVVTADATCSSGEVDITFEPAIYSTGAKQNVTALPTDNAAVTFLGNANGSYRQCLAFHKSAITLATADLVIPGGVHDAARKNYNGVSIRMITSYNSVNDEFSTRFDVFYGITVVYPEAGCRIWGA